MSRRVRTTLSRLGINRGAIVRRLVNVGHPRLRELSARRRSRPFWRVVSAPAAWYLNHGTIVIPSGRAGGLRLAKRHLPVAHAHLGSLAYGDLETSVQEAMRRHLGPGDVFYDVGANLGFFALLGAVFVDPAAGGWAYAFEPAPDNATAIRDNAELNGLANLTVIERAVSSRTGTARLQIVDDQSWSKLEDYGEHPYTERVVEVPTVALDDLVASGEIRPPTVVKLDIEGAEIAALEGMRETIAEHRPAIVCELHETHAAFVETMTGMGYRVVNLEGPEPVESAGASAHALGLPASG